MFKVTLNKPLKYAHTNTPLNVDTLNVDNHRRGLLVKTRIVNL